MIKSEVIHDIITHLINKILIPSVEVKVIKKHANISSNKTDNCLPFLHHGKKIKHFHKCYFDSESE
jgi:hypothetical protein